MLSARLGFLAVLIVLLVFIALPTLAATDDAGGFSDSSLQVVGYIVGILFNIGVVAGIRSRFSDSGKRFLTSGRFAFGAVYLLCFVELLVTGKFAAFDSAAALVSLIQSAAVMAWAAVGTHGAAKTTGLSSSLVKLIFGSVLLALAFTALCVPVGAQVQPAVLSESIVLAPPVIEHPALVTVTADPPEETNLITDSTAFSAAYAHSLKTNAQGLIGLVSLTVVQKPLAPDKSIAFTLNGAAVPVDGEVRFGGGVGISLCSDNLTMGIGIAYLPRPYELSVTLKLFERKL